MVWVVVRGRVGGIRLVVSGELAVHRIGRRRPGGRLRRIRCRRIREGRLRWGRGRGMARVDHRWPMRQVRCRARFRLSSGSRFMPYGALRLR